MHNFELQCAFRNCCQIICCSAANVTAQIQTPIPDWESEKVTTLGVIDAREMIGVITALTVGHTLGHQSHCHDNGHDIS